MVIMAARRAYRYNPITTRDILLIFRVGHGKFLTFRPLPFSSHSSIQGSTNLKVKEAGPWGITINRRAIFHFPLTILFCSLYPDSSLTFVGGRCHDQADAEWIVIRGPIRGHNDKPFGAYLVFSVTIN
jgi:hypothetical protein